MNRSLKIILLLIFSVNFSKLSFSEPVDSGQVIKHVSSYNIAALKELGPEVMPILSNLYLVSDIKQKRVIANIFYQLRLESEDAKNALIQDIKTDNEQLRISVQYALGRVSSDEEVVDALLYNMHNDNNAYFRDKAACALAYDQIHLTDEEKVRMYEGLIRGLSSSNAQVRSIALKALHIHTGQTKGFMVNGSARNQSESLRKWHRWLDEYKSNL
jgi:hypothetical protein